MPPKFRNIRIKKPGGGTRMQRAQVLKSGKLKFVKNIKRGGKKAAAKKAPARKRAVAKKAPARRRKSVAKKGNPNNKSPKIGAVLKGARAMDTISAPAQGVLVRGGGPMELIARYDNKDAVTTSAKAGAVGLVRNAITSKSGAYRGVSQNKILSYVQVLASEIAATSDTSPLADTKRFNDLRHVAHEAYGPEDHSFRPDNFLFRRSIILQALAWGGQKLAQKLGINRMLPKGWNL